MKNAKRLWLIAILLGLAFDFLFWKKTPGISFLIFIVLVLALGFLLFSLEGLRPARKSLLLVPPTLFLAGMTSLRTEPMTNFLNVWLTLFCMAVLVLTYSGGRWLYFNLGDYIAGFFSLLVASIVNGGNFLASTRRLQTESDAYRPRRWVGPALRGLLLTLPVLFLFAALLSSADLMFAKRLEEFTSLFRLENLPEYILRGILILIIAYILAGMFLHAASKSNNEKLVGEDKPMLFPFLGMTETVMVMGSVTILFTLFVIIQFQYFFGGQANVHIEGYTYSEYARRGFGELVAVAFFSLLLILIMGTTVKRETRAQHWIFSGLGAAIVLLVAIMLISAFQRLLLYESAYGFSRLRTYTHVFMFWLGLLLALAVLVEAMRRPRFFALAAVLASLGFTISLNLLNVDAFIVRQNVERSASGQPLDWQYLAKLSPDAVPALVEAFHTDSLSEKTHTGLGAALACRMSNSQTERHWQSFHFAHWQEQKLLEQVREELKGYTIHKDNWLLNVTSPDGEVYTCPGYY